jgi:hypothetical protein
MKSALLAAIFGITGGVAILLAVPAQEKVAVIKIQLPKSFPDYGEPMVPQIEETPPHEGLVPEPLDRYVGQTKTEKPAPRRRIHVARPQPNFFEKLVAGFIKLQKHPESKSKHQGSKSVHKRAHTTSPRD